MKLTQRNVYILCVVSLLITSIFSIGYHHVDEHFQLLEFAGYKLGLNTLDNLPWEYSSQLRPTLQPTLVVICYQLLDFIGINNPYYITLFLRLLSAALAFFCMHLLYKVYQNKISSSPLAKWFLLLSFLLWITMYNGVRFSSENWSGAFFVLGFCYYFLATKRKLFFFLTLGILFGFSFLFRYQSGFLIAGFVGWLAFIKKENLFKLGMLSIGVIGMIGVGVLIDKWFYGEWSFSVYNYFHENIVESRASDYGVDPWWRYLSDFFIQGVPPFSLLFIGSFMLLFTLRWKSELTWTLVPFILIHFIIAHKELRFLFPIVYFLPIVLINGFQLVEEKFIPTFTSSKGMKIFMNLFLTVYSVYLLVIMVKPAEGNMAMYHSVYNQYTEPVTLYIVTEFPERKELPYDFYQRQNLVIKKIKTLQDIDFGTSQTKLVAIDNQEFPKELTYKTKLIYATFPNWMKPFNVGNWMERSRFRRVYEITE